MCIIISTYLGRRGGGVEGLTKLYLTETQKDNELDMSGQHNNNNTYNYIQTISE